MGNALCWPETSGSEGRYVDPVPTLRALMKRQFGYPVVIANADRLAGKLLLARIVMVNSAEKNNLIHLPAIEK